MPLPTLSFDMESMLDRLRPWIECESPTTDPAAVDRMMDLAARDFVAAGASIERIPGRMGFGGALRARFPHRDIGKPGILVAGHFDTVHPVGTLQRLPFRREGNLCYGPGILDMKGGNFAAFEAMRQLVREKVETPLPVTFLFTPDEEFGTPSTRDIVESEGARSRCVLIPEPARDDGGAIIGRYAIARFNLTAHGRPSHAGSALRKSGRSAIARFAEKIAEIEVMTDEACTFSVGVIRGGEWVNCVSSLCTGEVLSMAKRQEDLDRGIAAMLALSGEVDGVKFVVKRGVTRPVWSPDNPGTQALYEIAREIARKIGFDMSATSEGGGSDGNFTGAMGIPTLDGLGVRGSDLHTLNEHIEVDSLVERARLFAGLMTQLN